MSNNQTSNNQEFRNEMHMLAESFHIILNEDHMPTFRNMMIPVSTCIHHGLLFVKNGEIVKEVPQTIYDIVKNAIGMVPSNANKTFHKSFETVEKSTIEDLVMEQLIHYFSTYGLEALGLTAHAYVPAEELELPVYTPKKIIIVNLVDPAQAIEVVNDYYKKVKQPSTNSIRAFQKLFDKYCTLEPEDIASFELQAIAYQRLNRVPQYPTQFLRFLVYVTTRQTMLVNSHRFAEMIKSYAKYGYFSKDKEVKEYFQKANLAGLASIFYRNKNIFLAFKAFDGCAPYINKIRRLANTYHKPLDIACVQNFTKMIAENYPIDEVNAIVESCDIYDTVKLINIITRKLNAPADKDAVFNIRTGSSFVKENGLKAVYGEEYDRFVIARSLLRVHLQHLCDLRGKTFYIPDYITYGFPTSQKQMIGAIPFGTTVSFPTDKSLVMGIYWENQNGQRVDLDLHMHGKGKTFGWNGYYRGMNEQEQVLFTGDQTDAKHGAAEAFYFKPGDEVYNLDVAQFAGPVNTPFKFYISEEKPDIKSQKYVFNPENALLPMIPVAMDSTFGHNMSLGFVKEGEFVFAGGAVSTNIGAYSKYYDTFLETQQDRYANSLTLGNVIAYCGGTVINEIPEVDEDGNMPEFISLAPEDLTLDTILNIFAQE